MKHFDLTNLDPTLLEKIITKLDIKSYFRVQQTCHYMESLVRRSKNISVRMDNPKCSSDISLEALYGVRLNYLRPPRNAWMFDEYCDNFLKFRITCEEMLSFPEWPVEQCARLLKILKPVKVELNSEGSNRLEALFQAKSLKSVKVFLDYGVVPTVLTRFLSTFQEVKILVFATSDKFRLFRKVVHLIRSHPFSNLRKFRLAVMDPGFSQSKLDEHLQDMDLTAKTEQVRISDGCYCKIDMEGREYIDVEIYYGVNLFV